MAAIIENIRKEDAKMKKFNVNKINLEIEEIIPFCNTKASGLYIDWSSDIGFGGYTIYREHGSDKWEAQSEYMDSNDDKNFLKKLLEKFVEMIEVVG